MNVFSTEWPNTNLFFCYIFSVPQIEYSLGGSSKKGSHVNSCHDTTIVMSDCTTVISGHHGSIRTTFISNNSSI